MQKICPACHHYLAEVEHMGVLVDVCSQCKGIWLERGELEKIIGYIRGTMAPPQHPERVEEHRRARIDDERERYDEPRRRGRYDDDDDADEYDDRRRRKRRFGLDDVLEIFGGD